MIEVISYATRCISFLRLFNVSACAIYKLNYRDISNDGDEENGKTIKRYL